MTLESSIGAVEFISDFNVIDVFINKEVKSQEEEDVWEEPHQGLPESPDMDDVVNQENAEKAVDTYDQFVSTEVCLPDKLRSKMMAIFTKSVKYNEGKPRGIEHPSLFAYNSLYEA